MRQTIRFAYARVARQDARNRAGRDPRRGRAVSVPGNTITAYVITPALYIGK
jgi:hypothetical protein